MIDRIVEVDARGSRCIGLVADSHGPLDRRLVEALAGCDFLIHAGDLGGPSALDSLVSLAAAAAVRGNNDTPEKWGSAEIKRLDQLPSVLRVVLTGGYVIVLHGHQFPQAKKRHRQLRDRYPDAMAIVYGHSHRAVIDTQCSPWVLNPGASGRSRTYGGPSGLILERNSRTWAVSSIRLPLLQRGHAASA